MTRNTDSQDSSETKRSRRAFLATSGAAAVAGLAGCLSGGGSDGGDTSEETATSQRTATSESTETSESDDTSDTTATDSETGQNAGTSQKTGTSGGSDSGAGTTRASAPSKPDKLVVRAWGGSWQKSLKSAVAKPFTDDTGIDVEFDNTSEEVMQGKIRTAIKQHRTPPVNVNWSTTPLTYKSFKQGLMEPLSTDVMGNLETLLPPAQPDVGDMAWPFTSLYSYVYTLSYNTNEVDSAPSSWNDWWNDEWKNGLGLYQNGTGFNPVVGKMVGLDTPYTADPPKKVWDKYRKLKSNVGLIADDTQITQNLRKGEISMCTLIVSNTYNAKKDGAPVDYTIPDEGAVAKRDAMWIPKGQKDKHTYWGQVFIDHAIDETNIGDFAKKLGFAPLNPAAKIPSEMQNSEAFPTTEEEFNSLITVDPSKYVNNSSQWFSKFNQILKA